MSLISALRPDHNLQAFRELLGLLGRHRALAIEMARRELTERYSGQMFGSFWAIVHPLFMISVYVFVFSVVFRMKVGGSKDMPLDYTTYLLSGLLPWMCFQEAMTKSATGITTHASLVKQVVFPLEVLPVKSVLVALVNQLIAMTLMVVYVLAIYGTLHWTYLMLPVLIVLQVVAMIGVAFLLSAVGAYVRDAKDMVQLFGLAGMYLIPVVYLPEWVPDLLRPLLYLNPFSYMVWCYQDVLYFGRFEHPEAWALFAACSLGIFVFGFRVFRRLKPAFGNVL
jgi:lipopolysaccharide transport system permease protein